MAGIADHVRGAIDSWHRSETDFAVLHACLAVDGAARELYGRKLGNRARFVRFLRERYWLLEPTAMPGIDLELTRFSTIPLGKIKSPDWAEVVYEIFRCSHAHGEDVPSGFHLTPGVGFALKTARIGEGEMEIPDNLPFGLLFAAVLAPVEVDRRVPDGYHLTLGHLDHSNFMQFPINDWWGCEDDFRPIAAKHNEVRVQLKFEA